MGDVAVMTSVNPMQFSPGGERRQFRRFPMSIPVKAKRDDLAGGQVARQGSPPEGIVNLEIMNFSLGGMRGSSSVALRQGEALTVCMPPFGTRPEVNITGRVTRCQRLETRFDVGIEFCQTRSAPHNSPWLRLPEIFYMAGQMKEKGR